MRSRTRLASAYGISRVTTGSCAARMVPHSDGGAVRHAGNLGFQQAAPVRPESGGPKLRGWKRPGNFRPQVPRPHDPPDAQSAGRDRAADLRLRNMAAPTVGSPAFDRVRLLRPL